jgi:hypothetical protein
VYKQVKIPVFGGCFNYCYGSERTVEKNNCYVNTCKGVIIQKTCGNIFSGIFLNLFGIIDYIKEDLIGS